MSLKQVKKKQKLRQRLRRNKGHRGGLYITGNDIDILYREYLFKIFEGFVK